VHRFNIMRKTGTRNISQLIQLRIQAGDAGSMSDAGLRPGEI
jgi:DNA-binding NarL/FixJ family response regulator